MKNRESQIEGMQDFIDEHKEKPAKFVFTGEDVEKVMQWRFAGSTISNQDSQWTHNEREKDARSLLASLNLKSEKETIAEWLESEEPKDKNYTAGQYEGIPNYENPYKIDEAKAFLRKAMAAKLRGEKDGN